MSHTIRTVIMRGGTSKALFLKEADLPRDAAIRQAMLLALFGSPDKRQIDGLGGADPLTSKLAIIGPPRKDVPGAENTDLTYTFAQVEIDKADIDYLSLCGNITSAVGSFAITENLVAPVSPITSVRIYNTNLACVLTVEVPVENGRVRERGDYTVPGVPGSGARILVDFSDTAGRATGRLLPTGNPLDDFEVPGFGKLSVSLIDMGNAHVFLRAADVGLTGTETAAEIDGMGPLKERLEVIRGMAAERMGLINDWQRSKETSPATPILGMVSPPADYLNTSGRCSVKANEVDVVSRLMFMQQMHKTYAGTSTVCTGIASRVPGTLVHEMTPPENRTAATCRIGHPAGVIETECSVEVSGNDYRVKRATLGRTARRLLEGIAYLPDGYETRHTRAE